MVFKKSEIYGITDAKPWVKYESLISNVLTACPTRNSILF